MHLKSSETINKHGTTFKVFGKVVYSNCSICGVCLHLMSNRGKSAGPTCSFDHHNDDFFGLARADAGLSKTKSLDCTYPSLYHKRENTTIIDKLNDEIA